MTANLNLGARAAYRRPGPEVLLWDIMLDVEYATIMLIVVRKRILPAQAPCAFQNSPSGSLHFGYWSVRIRGMFKFQSDFEFRRQCKLRIVGCRIILLFEAFDESSLAFHNKLANVFFSQLLTIHLPPNGKVATLFEPGTTGAHLGLANDSCFALRATAIGIWLSSGHGRRRSGNDLREDVADEFDNARGK